MRSGGRGECDRIGITHPVDDRAGASAMLPTVSVNFARSLVSVVVSVGFAI